MRLAAKGRLLAALLRAEGPRSVLRRFADRATEVRRRRRFLVAREPEHLRSPLLIVLATRPAPRLGGVQIQLLRRLVAFERAGEPYALLYPLVGREWRLEVFDGARRWRRAPAVASAGAKSEVMAGGDAWEAIGEARRLTSAQVVQLENAGDFLAPPSIAGAPWSQIDGSRLVAAVHDFGLYCYRPHLLEQPRQEFCNYSRDLERCARCLLVDLPHGAEELSARRLRARALLQRASTVVFPSGFLRDRHQELFPDLQAAQCRVIEPLVPRCAARDPSFRGQRSVRGQRLTVAAIGSVKPHKGSQVLRQLLALDQQRGARFSWVVFGGGDAEALVALRSTGARVTGYYREGELAATLRRHAVDIALVLSIWPESFAMTVDEAWSARCPVLAFGIGAPGERMAERGGGVGVPLESGAAGLLEALDRLDAGRLDAGRGALARLRAEIALRIEAPAVDPVAVWRLLYREC
jgi:glycosyltransferase involved in cell wall biosynthesis